MASIQTLSPCLSLPVSGSSVPPPQHGQLLCESSDGECVNEANVPADFYYYDHYDSLPHRLLLTVSLERQVQFDRYLSSPDTLVMPQLNFLLSAAIK